jgi:hypothetical protein
MQPNPKAFPEYLTTVQAAGYLNVSRQFLKVARRRVAGTGPRFRLIGGAVRYRRSDLDSWMALHDDASDDPNRLTEDRYQRWAASNKAEALAIDIETCVIGSWPGEECDPYGMSGLPLGIGAKLIMLRFVCCPTGGRWINEKDLPVEKFRAMYDRMRREYEAEVVRCGGDPALCEPGLAEPDPIGPVSLFVFMPGQT